MGGELEAFGLALAAGWPSAELHTALRLRARPCSVLELPLLPSAVVSGRLSRRKEEKEKEGEENLYEDDDGEMSEYSRRSKIEEDMSSIYV